MRQFNRNVSRCSHFIPAAFRTLTFSFILLVVSFMSSGGLFAAGPSTSFVPGKLLVQFKKGVDSARANAITSHAGAKKIGEISQIRVHILQLPPTANVAAIQHAFQGEHDVAFAQPDYQHEPAMTPDDPLYLSTAVGNGLISGWHLPKIAAPSAWDTTTGNGVTIAILDTGVEATHPDLEGQLVSGWNMFTHSSSTADWNGHGTGVAGAAAAASNNGIGVSSVCGGAKIMPIVIGDQLGVTSDSFAAGAITWAADHGARVASLSYNITNSPVVSAAAQYMQSKGGVVIGAAGNWSNVDLRPDDPYIINVSSTGDTDELSIFTTTGTNVDLAAPGEFIKTTIRGGGYDWAAGTSFSTPITAGVAGLVIAANPSLTGQQVQEVLKQSADDLGPIGWDQGFGSGRVNAAKAVALAQSLSPDTAPPTVSITAPLAGVALLGTVTVKVAAMDNRGVTEVTLNLDGTEVGSTTSLPYEFELDTTAFTNGAHSLSAVASDAAGNQGRATIVTSVDNPPPDTTRPVVTIVSPAEGSTISPDTKIQVSATDEGGMWYVYLYVNGQPFDSSMTAPYEFSFGPFAELRTYTLTAWGRDKAGNWARSQEVSVTLAPGMSAGLPN